MTCISQTVGCGQQREEVRSRRSGCLLLQVEYQEGADRR